MTQEEMAQEFAHSCAEYNNLPIEVEHLLHTAFIAGYNRSASDVTDIKIQDNASKAREIAKDFSLMDFTVAKEAAEEMAEWKDQQFKEHLEYLEKKLSVYQKELEKVPYEIYRAMQQKDMEFKEYLERKKAEHKEGQIGYYIFDEIINEFFGGE